jgi:hypothetical protein
MPQNIMPCDMIEWTVEKYTIIKDLKDSVKCGTVFSWLIGMFVF